VYLDGVKGNKLQVEKVELKEILDENINDLEKFVDTMKIIK
jgi:hypothetical protein